jgi:hypothetical protein
MGAIEAGCGPSSSPGYDLIFLVRKGKRSQVRSYEAYNGRAIVEGVSSSTFRPAQLKAAQA